MRKIVLSAAAMMVLAVGGYHAAVLAGVSPSGAAFAVFACAAFAGGLVPVVAIVVAERAPLAAFAHNGHHAPLAAFVFAVTDFAAAALTAGTVTLVVLHAHVAAAIIALACVVIAAFASIIALANADEKERVRFRWVFATYTVEALAVWGALVVGHAGWSIAIVIAGIAGIVAIGKVSLVPTPTARTA